jgi:sulfide:quinone oxidoreductase
MSIRQRVVILGSSFAGLTAALELTKRVGDRHEIVVVDPRAEKDPGPVVVGTAQGGSCFGASYEFLFNIHHQIKKAGLADVAPVTFITPEPFLGHFGLGGVGASQAMVERFFDRLGIEGLPNSSIKEVREREIELESGRTLPFAYSMIVPPFTGVDPVREADGLANPMGFIPVDDQYRHPEHREVFAAGVAIALAPPGATPVPAGVPKTGQMTETMAKVAAHNIADDLERSGTDSRFERVYLGSRKRGALVL